MDSTTIVGGSTFGAHKYLADTQLVEHHVVQRPDAHFLSQELHLFAAMSEAKRQQLTGLAAEFEDELAQHIRSWRKDRLQDEGYRKTLLVGEQAVKAGLADGVGTLNGVLWDQYPGVEVRPHVEPAFYKQLKRIRNWGGAPKYI